MVLLPVYSNGIPLATSTHLSVRSSKFDGFLNALRAWLEQNKGQKTTRNFFS